MRPGSSRLWISVFLLVASTVIALPDDPKVAAKPAALGSVVQTKESQAAMTPSGALDTLKEGNKRFRAGTSVQTNLMAKVKASAPGQYPFAVVLGCMDSRVPAEALFDQSIGDLFNIRVAGNVVNVDNLGSLEYAAKVIGVKTIVVLGHTSCGAIKGAIDNAKLGNLTAMLRNFDPALKAVGKVEGERKSSNKYLVQKVADANAKLSAENLLKRSPVLKGLVDKGQLKIVAAMHDLATGKVSWLA